MPERVLINAGTNKGKMATVIEYLPNRLLVYVDGYLSSDGVRTYAHTSVTKIPVSVPPTTTPPLPPQSQYKFNTLVADEQFANLDQWHLYNGPGHGDNGLRHPSAWAIQEGIDGATGKCLVCTAKWVDGQSALDMAAAHLTNAQRSSIMNGAIVSGGMSHKLQGLVNFRAEARVKFDHDPSNVTSALFMTWPDGPGDGGWPENGEHNIWEAQGSKSPMYTFIHYDVTNKQFTYPHPNSDGSKWNVVCMEKTADYIKIFVNDVLSWTLTDKIAITSHPHHVTLQQDAHVNRDPGRHVKAYYDWVKIYK